MPSWSRPAVAWRRWASPTPRVFPRRWPASPSPCPFNDLAAARALFEERGKDIAAVIIEPVVGNMGVLVPRAAYLEGLAALCKAAGALLILDEVMTGFRLAPGGAQELFGLQPDLTCLGKVIGGGLPVGAFGGPAGDHGDRRSGRAGVPGGDALRESAGRGRRAGLPPRARALRGSTSGWRSSPGHSPMGSSPRRVRPRCR